MIAAVSLVMISAPTILGIISQALAADITPKKKCDRACQQFENKVHEMMANPAGSNMTSGSNMTAGSNMTGNTTVGTHGSAIPTTHPAGVCCVNRP